MNILAAKLNIGNLWESGTNPLIDKKTKKLLKKGRKILRKWSIVINM